MRRAAAALAMAFAAGCSREGEEDKRAEIGTFLAMNGENPQALQERFSSDANAVCSVGADNYLRSIARYDFAWDDDAKGLLAIKFDKFSKSSAGRGLLTVVSEKAKLANGFGAFSHVNVYCLYDVAAKRVVRFSGVDPSLKVSTTTLGAGRKSAPALEPGKIVASTVDFLPTSASSSDRAKMARWLKLETLCRGSSDEATIDSECPRRDALGDELQRVGWCWAYDDAQILPVDYKWHWCSDEAGRAESDQGGE